MRIAIIGLSMLTLSACGAADSEFGTEEAAGPCGNIQAMLDARTEAEPFKRLRGVNKMMGDTPLSDTFIGMHKPFGAWGDGTPPSKPRRSPNPKRRLASR